jgi:hypothetical protein
VPGTPGERRRLLRCPRPRAASGYARAWPGLGSQSPWPREAATAERQSLRQYLREQVDPAEVWHAFKAALESGSQTAVVSAARLLVTELYEEREDEDKARDHKLVVEQARAHLDVWLPKVCAAVIDRLLKDEGPQKTDPMIVHRVLELVEQRLQVEIDKLGVELKDVRSVVLYDFGPERAAKVFEQLEEVGARAAWQGRGAGRADSAGAARRPEGRARAGRLTWLAARPLNGQ